MLAFRLPADTFEHDGAIRELLEQVAEDQRDIPAHRRPRDPGEFEQAMPLLIAINQLADDTMDLERLGGTAFRAGLEAACATLRDRYGDLGPALADCWDFTAAAADPAAQMDRSHDLLAVALRWRGEPIGYVPHRVNAQIAQLLDAGEALLCQISRFDEHADLWERVEVSIRQFLAP